MALFFGIPQGDTNDLAHRLLDRFGSFSAVLDAPYEQLLEINGMGENAATFLRCLPALCRKYRLDRIASNNLFESDEKIGRYLLAYFMGEQVERSVLLSFDGKRRLLGVDRPFSSGLTDMAEITTRRIAELALAHRAHYVVLAHNHPSGICEPSEFDITATNALDYALHSVGLQLIEHYVVTEEEFCGIKAFIHDGGYELNYVSF